MWDKLGCGRDSAVRRIRLQTIFREVARFRVGWCFAGKVACGGWVRCSVVGNSCSRPDHVSSCQDDWSLGDFSLLAALGFIQSRIPNPESTRAHMLTVGKDQDRRRLGYFSWWVYGIQCGQCLDGVRVVTVSKGRDRRRLGYFSELSVWIKVQEAL